MPDGSQLENLLLYLQETWLETWELRQWSIYWMPVRTNNDVQGWHDK